MEPKDKAKELIWKVLPKIEGWTDPEKTEKAKEISIIFIDEILNAPKIGEGWIDKYEPFWKYVKSEIEKL